MTELTRSNTALIYGQTGSTKTSNGGHFASYIYEETGKITRYVLADPGGCDPIKDKLRRVWDMVAGRWEEVNPLGIIDLLDIRWADYPMSLSQRLSTGDWPLESETGQGADGPVHLITFEQAGAATWEEVGGYVIEGVTTLGFAFLDTLLREGPRLSQKPSYVYSEQGPDGSMVNFHGGNESYYGLVQNRTSAVIKNFGRLPTRVLWTAHEAVGEERATGQTIVGPEVPGKKATARVPTWVGDCFHLYSPPQTTPGVAKPRLYFMRHLDAVTEIPYPAKPRVPSNMMPKLLERWPEGYVDVTFEHGIDEFLRFQQQLLGESTDLFLEWRKRIDVQRKAAETPIQPR